MNRCSFCEWIPILPWPVWPLAGQSLLGQNVVVGSMMVLLALCGSMPRGVYLGPHFRYKCASPRLSAELPDHLEALKELTFPFYDLCAARPQRWLLGDRYGPVRSFALLLRRDAHADHRRNLPS